MYFDNLYCGMSDLMYCYVALTESPISLICLAVLRHRGKMMTINKQHYFMKELDLQNVCIIKCLYNHLLFLKQASEVK